MSVSVWDDRDVLGKEPLQGLFAARACAGPDKRGGGNKTTICIAASLLEETKTGTDWRKTIQSWLNLAFHPNIKEKREVRRSRVLVDQETAEIFVEFFWTMKNKGDYLRYLNLQRNLREFGYNFNPRDCDGPNKTGRGPSSGTKARKQGQNAGDETGRRKRKRGKAPGRQAPIRTASSVTRSQFSANDGLRRRSDNIGARKLRGVASQASIHPPSTEGHTADASLPGADRSAPITRSRKRKRSDAMDPQINASSLDMVAPTLSANGSGRVAPSTRSRTRSLRDVSRPKIEPSSLEKVAPTDVSLKSTDHTPANSRSTKRMRRATVSPTIDSSTMRAPSAEASPNDTDLDTHIITPPNTLDVPSTPMEDALPTKNSSPRPAISAVTAPFAALESRELEDISSPNVLADAQQITSPLVARSASPLVSQKEPSLKAEADDVTRLLPLHPDAPMMSWITESELDLLQQQQNKPTMPSLPTPVSSQDGFEDDNVMQLCSLEDKVSLLATPQDIQTFKPPLPKYPPIWSQSRQEVCESFDWFRSFHGGVYSSKDMVKGYLLSAFSSSRDLFRHGGKLIISHGGGKAEGLHYTNGHVETHAADDQLEQDKSVRALLNNYKHQRPIALIIDDRYTKFPYDLGINDIVYAVLGFYTIAHAWAEYQPDASNPRGRVVRYKFAFQWCEAQGQPWWNGNGRDALDEQGPPTPPPTPYANASLPQPGQLISANLTERSPHRPDDLYFACDHCGETTPHVYMPEWTCLNPACRVFWTLRDGRPVPEHLDYNPRFLNLGPSLSLPPGFEDIRPPPPLSAPRDHITTTYPFSRGWHCRDCGRLSCRFKWQHWECQHCKSVIQITGCIRKAKEFWKIPIPVSFLDSRISPAYYIQRLPVKTFLHGAGMGQYQTFVLPENRGRIHHIQGGTFGNREADKIFTEYQEQAADGSLVFRRWPLRSHKLRGPLLTNYFSQNCGEPYQYVGGTDNTVPFDQAPSGPINARKLMQGRIHDALGLPSEFNEVLSAAYMERQKMAFHSDAERGLGEMVAGLSLGSPALMHFRLHAKYEQDRENRSLALSVVLRHGDVLVMDGAGVQTYYEHTVVPTNFRISATARLIASGTGAQATSIPIQKESTHLAEQ